MRLDSAGTEWCLGEATYNQDCDDIREASCGCKECVGWEPNPSLPLALSDSDLWCSWPGRNWQRSVFWAAHPDSGRSVGPLSLPICCVFPAKFLYPFIWLQLVNPPLAFVCFPYPECDPHFAWPWSRQRKEVPIVLPHNMHWSIFPQWKLQQQFES